MRASCKIFSIEWRYYVYGIIRMNDYWSDEELRASVEAYVEMQRGERAGQLFTKQQYYKELARTFDRSEKAIECRMQNISFVLSLMGRGWLTGLKPDKGIDAGVAAKIEKLVGEIEGQKTAPVVAFEIAVREKVSRKKLAASRGSPHPKAKRVSVTQFRRKPAVKAWVLQQAGGVCEGCEKPAPFVGTDGMPYLELHYVRQLAEGGPDIVSNAVALCPNCHREIHYGASAQALEAWLFDNIGRLIRV
ncbi:MAG: HNH endonuclease [Nitrosospira sp.]|nr:HNH endonuclease [Nitrosospira sp.]